LRTVDRISSPGFQQFHIDVARNSSDDFDPLHDPVKWQSVRGNPYGMAVASVFQLECLIEYLLVSRRHAWEWKLIETHGLRFCSYEFVFERALRPGEAFDLSIGPAVEDAEKGFAFSHRVVVLSKSERVLTGSLLHTAVALHPGRLDPPSLSGLERHPDITYVPGTPYFLKRKFLSTASAKNFVAASLADQAYYFDEVTGRVNFPDMVPVSFVASALFDKLAADNIDYRTHPILHRSHRISVDQQLARRLGSNDKLDILLEGPLETPAASGEAQPAALTHHYTCFGLVADRAVLFRAEVSLIPDFPGQASAAPPR
jgi:hypothetical protein